jgi:hypothetical protein
MSISAQETGPKEEKKKATIYFFDGLAEEGFGAASSLLSSLVAKIFSAIPFLVKNSSGTSTEGVLRKGFGLSNC